MPVWSLPKNTWMIGGGLGEGDVVRWAQNRAIWHQLDSPCLEEIPSKFCGGSWSFELPSNSLRTLRIWRGSVKRSGPKSLPRSVQTCWKTTTNIWPLFLPTEFSPPSIKSYCSMDQILISCENMIINIYNLYILVILDFVKMYLWLKLYTVPIFVSGQTYKISKGSNNYCSHCKW